MRLFNSVNDYGAVAQALHWLTVILVALAWALGIFGDLLPKGAARQAGLAVHIYTGLALLVLVAARLTWRSVDASPALEVTELGPDGKVARVCRRDRELCALRAACRGAGCRNRAQFARGDAL
ncbi:cytochrome b [Bradyrhizobium japonicum]|uniref:cytochrome b n=1 Tax=Bradyrhizobium japonicum TaxID=375 RepID=UPI0030F36ED4